MTPSKRRAGYVPSVLAFAFLIFVSYPAVQPAQTCVPPPMGMVSGWTADGNANQIGGTGLNGTLRDGASFSVLSTGSMGKRKDDADGDGVPDTQDDCPDSIVDPTVVLGGCDSGVPNTVFPNGCTVSDRIQQCAVAAENHGQFVSCVAHLTNEVKKAGVITGQQKGAIQSCAAGYELTAVLTDDFTPCWGPPQGPTDTPSRGRVLMAHSRDGLSFQRPADPELALVVDRVGVPDAVLLPSGRILLYFVAGCKYYEGAEHKVDEIAVGVSDNKGFTWVFKNVEFTGIPVGLSRPVDPNVILMPNGKLSLFTTMWDSPPGGPAVPPARTYSFLSTDGGFTYTFRGLRYAPGHPDGVLDPENYRFSNTIWQILTGGPFGHGLSIDGGETFRSLGSFSETSVVHEVSITETPGTYRAYALGAGGLAISSFRSSAAPWTEWIPEEGNRLELTPSPMESCELAFPTVVKLAKHRYLMMYQTVIPGCSCPEAGAPSCP